MFLISEIMAVIVSITCSCQRDALSIGAVKSVARITICTQKKEESTNKSHNIIIHSFRNCQLYTVKFLVMGRCRPTSNKCSAQLLIIPHYSRANYVNKKFPFVIRQTMTYFYLQVSFSLRKNDMYPLIILQSTHHTPQV